MDALEQRVLLSLTSSVDASGLLSVSVNDGSPVALTVSSGNVQVDGADPGSGAAAASSIKKITVTATGSFSNAIDLSHVTSGNFTELLQVSVDGGAGGDSLAGPDVTKTWAVTSSNAGNLSGLGGKVTSFDFANIESLIGGSGDDTFRVSNGAGVTGTIAGNGGADLLDDSAYTTAVSVNLATGAATNTGGIGGIENVTGGSGNDTLTGDAAANVLSGGAGDDVLSGGAGNDVLNPGTGRNTLLGGAGSDTFNGGPSISATFGDALFTKLANVRKLILGDINNSGFTNFVYNHNQIPFISFNAADNQLSSVAKADVIGTFYNVLHNALNGLSSASDVQEVLYNVLGTSGQGLGILADANGNGSSDVDDVSVVIDNTNAADSRISFETPLHKSAYSSSSGNPNYDTSTQLDLDLHLPGLPVNSGPGQVDGVLVAAGYDYDLKFGVSQASGAFIDYSKTDELKINLVAGLTVRTGDTTHGVYNDANGSLGLLYANIQDNPANHSLMTATLFVDLAGESESTPPTVKIAANVAYHLKLSTRSTSDGSDAINPVFGANLDVAWTIGSQASPQTLGGASLLGAQPTVAFNSVTLDANSFFQYFLKPIVQDHIRSIFSTIDPLVEIITYKLPLINVSAGQLLDNPLLSSALVGNFDAFFQALQIFKDMTFPTPGGTISLGSFTVTDDARTKNHGPNGNDFVDLSSANVTPPSVDPVQQLRNLSPDVNTFFSNLDLTFTYGLGGTPGISPFQTVTYHLLSFPMFDNASINSFHMLLGHHADLLKWDVPPISVFFTMAVKQGLYPVGGGTEITAGDIEEGKAAGLVALFVLRPSFQAHWAGGYDTHGFELETPSEGYYLSGTDTSKVHPTSVSTIADDFNQSQMTSSFMRLNIDVSALVGPSIPLGPLNVTFGVGAGLTGVVNWDVHDPNLDGDPMRLRPSEQALDEQHAGTFYDVFGSLLFNIDLFLKITLDLAFVKIPILTRLQHLAQFKLFQGGGAIDTSGAAAAPLANYDSTSKYLTLNTVKTIADPNHPELADDAFIVKTLQVNPDGTNNVEVISGGRAIEYDNVSRIVADGGAGNDSFIIKEGSTVPVSLIGGDGNDHLEYRGSGNATLNGGAGDDNLFSGSGNDSIDAGAGNDHIESDGGNDTIVGGDGNDEIEAGNGDDVVYGDNADGSGTGDDTIDPGTGNNTVYAGAGSDLVLATVAGANTTADGGAGSDELDAQFGSNPDDIRLLREALAGGGWGFIVQTADAAYGSIHGRRFETLGVNAGDQGNLSASDDVAGRPGDVIHVNDLSGTGITTLNLTPGANANPDHERDSIYIEGTPQDDTLTTAATYLADPNDPSSAIDVTQVTGLPYTVRIPATEPLYDSLVIEGNGGNDNLIVAPPVPVNEQQKVIVSGLPTGGTFTISFGNQTTTAVSATASAADVQTALQALPNIGAGNATVSLSTATDGTRTYLVTFVAALGRVPQPVLTTVDKKQKITIAGAPTGGSFYVTYESATTAAIAYNATAAAVQSALAALPNVGAGNVLVTGSAASGYTVEFLRDNPALITTDAFTGGTSPRTQISNLSTLTGGSSPSTSVSEVTFGNSGRIDDKLMLTLDGGAGTDTVTASMDADFVLSDSNLNISTHGNVTLSSIESANLTGGGSANHFTVTDWTGSGTLTGGAGNDVVIATNDADFTLSDTLLTRTAGHGDLVLNSVDTANLTGGASANSFTVGNWTGTANLDGKDAGDAYTVNFQGSGAGVTHVQDTGATGTDTVIVNGTPNADPFEITGAAVSRAAEQATYAGVETLTVNALGAADTLNVRGTSIPTTVNGGDGNDIVNVGSLGNTLDGITAALAINGGANDAAPTSTLAVTASSTSVSNTLATGDAINFNDQGRSTAGTYSLTATTLQQTAAAASALITYGTAETVTLNAGASAADVVNVIATAASVNTSLNTGGGDDAVNVTTTGAASNVVINTAGSADAVTLATTGQGSVTRINTGAGNDTVTQVANGAASGVAIDAGDDADQVNVRGTTAGTATNVAAGAGNDTVNVGSLAPLTGGVARGIQGSLRVDGGADTDTLNVDDTGDTANSASTLYATLLAGLGMGPDGIAYYNFENMNVGLGSGNDSVRLNDTGAVTVINGNAGNDSFTVGPDVDQNGVPIGAVVNGTSNVTTLNGGDGNDSFTVNRNTATLNLNGQDGDDTFTVNTIVVPSSVSNISGGAGNDATYVYLANAPVNIDGGSGNNTLVINGSLLADVFNVTATSITVVGSRTIPYRNIQSLIINGGLGNDTFNVDTTLDDAGHPVAGTALAAAALNGQAGSDTFNLKPSPFTTFNVDGGDPTPPLLASQLPGDAMYLTLGNTEYRRLNATGTNAGGGTWSFGTAANHYLNIAYRKIEKMNHVGVEVTSPGAGLTPTIHVFDAETKYERVPAFLGMDANNKAGSRVATGDVNGDGIPDIIVAGGPGAAPEVRVFNGATGAQFPGTAGDFMALDGGSKAGLWVAAADINRDGLSEIITAPDSGNAAVVRVWTVAGIDVAPANNWRLAQQFTAYPGGMTGVRLAAADVNGDSVPDVITAPGIGQSSNVRVFDLSRGFSTTPTMIGSFGAFGGNFQGGTFVAAADVNGDRVADVIVSQGSGGNGLVQIYDGRTITKAAPTLIAQFTPYAGYHGEVRVAAVDVNNDGRAEVMTAPSPNSTQPVSVWQLLTGGSVSLLDSYSPYGSFNGGIFIAGGN